MNALQQESMTNIIVSRVRCDNVFDKQSALAGGLASV